MPERFRKKPVIVEAVKFTGHNDDEIQAFVGSMGYDPEERRPSWMIKTLEGDMHISVGDWIIRGTQGEFYPCKPGAFEDSYEPI